MTDPSPGFRGIAKFVCGIVGLVLFRWMPLSGKGLLLYGALLVLLVPLCHFAFSEPQEHEREPGPPFP